MNSPKDFQNKSAGRIVELFEKGQQRVLLADEVGLGKTIVARTVVELMREKSQAKGKQFKVIYVCSNQDIIQQNAHKLGIVSKNVVPLSESRLSMQHKVFFDQQNRDYLIPITPSTSLRQTRGYGNANERALIYLLINEDFRELSLLEDLKDYLDVYSSTGHTYEFTDLVPEQIENDDPKYYSFIRAKIKENDIYKTAIAGIIHELKFKTNSPNRTYINDLRTLFREISMDMIKPNLVIMDEFQRYSDLMQGGQETEENKLAQKLFNAESNPKILLVSATPYKPFETMESISQEGKNIQFEDFNNLMSFLMGNNYAKFKQLWLQYSAQLASMDPATVDSLLKVKGDVEAELRKVMVRTERYVPNLATYSVQRIMPKEEEVTDYNMLRQTIDSASKDSGKTKAPLLNIDYSKSSPYLLSFMQHYVEKSYIETAYRGRRGPKKHIFNGLLIKEDDLSAGRKIDCRNARLQVLNDMVFRKGGTGMNNLLWVPPSLPYYKTKGVFSDNAGASKVLVFSKWGFVPRMIAAMLSYEDSRLSHQSRSSNSNSNALEKYKELLLSPFPYIAAWFPKAKTCCNLEKLKSSIGKKIDKILGKEPSSQSHSRSANNLLQLAKFLNGDKKTNIDIEYDKQTRDDIINLIIASPGICMWRCFGSDYGDTYESCKNSVAFQFANSFVNMLGSDEGQAIINHVFTSGTKYSKTLQYCVIGNLQAMIDEYAFVMGYSMGMSPKEKRDLFATMQSAIINRTTIEIDTDNSFCVSGAKKYSVQRWLACDYAKISSDDNDERRTQSIQAAFNSPFRPFVLASTSVGQEGLDFHLYCRKIVHWNLPGNPINLEQRSGRINRYEGLAVRRTVSHLFEGTLDWNELFKEAKTSWHKKFEGYNEMVPHWCVPKECLENDDDERIERIENIFPLYALSRDIEDFNSLMERLDLYRLTMGQPDQEFILDLLAKHNFSDEIKDQLTFHLSPS